MATSKSTRSKKGPAKAAAKPNARTTAASAKQKSSQTKAKTKAAAAKASAAKAKSRAASSAKARQDDDAQSPVLQPLINLRRQIDDMVNETIGRFPHFQLPKIEWPLFAKAGADADIAKFDFSENDKAVTVTAEVPGMTEDDVEVTLHEGVLTIRGEKKSEREEKGENFYLSERRFGSFSRAFRLPEGVKEDEIAASFKKGVLTVTLPKAARAQKAARRVSVKSS